MKDQDSRHIEVFYRDKIRHIVTNRCQIRTPAVNVIQPNQRDVVRHRPGLGIPTFYISTRQAVYDVQRIAKFGQMVNVGFMAIERKDSSGHRGP